MGEDSVVFGGKIALAGAVLIFINVLILSMNSAPIILSSYQVSSVSQLITPPQDAGLWARIAFGNRMVVNSGLMALWIIFAGLCLLGAVILYSKPVNPLYPSLAVLIFSLLSIFTGGGFIVGMVLGVLGATIALQWRKPWRETFFIRMLRSMKFDSEMFSSVKNSIEDNVNAAFTVVAANFLGMFGASLYIFNVNLILSPESPEDPVKILLLGETAFDFQTLATPFAHIGIGIFKWLLITSLFYLFGTKILGRKAEFDSVARVTAYAYSPRILMIFLPLIFTNQPFLTYDWPVFALSVTRLWIFFALIVAARAVFEISLGRAFGITLLASGIYWIIMYNIVAKHVEIPGIMFTIGPEFALLMLVSLAALLALLLGVFKRE